MQKVDFALQNPHHLWWGFLFGGAIPMRFVELENIQYAKKKGLALANPLYFLAPRPGLEPGTYGLTDTF